MLVNNNLHQTNRDRLLLTTGLCDYKIIQLKEYTSRRTCDPAVTMKDRVCEFECNIDDMTAEELAFAAERLIEEGARDVTLSSVQMKKGRPATLMTVMCADDEAEKERIAGLIFRYTSTIGIRELISERYILDRREKTVETAYGSVRYKEVSGFGVSRYKFEYEDLARIARELDISIAEARSIAEKEK